MKRAKVNCAFLLDEKAVEARRVAAAGRRKRPSATDFLHGFSVVYQAEIHASGPDLSLSSFPLSRGPHQQPPPHFSHMQLSIVNQCSRSHC